MRTKRLLLLAIAVLLIASGAGWYAWAEKFSPAARHKNLVRYMLKDPESAQFRAVFTSKRDGETWCGEMNGRNAMGGMVGFKRYVFTAAKGVSPDEDRELFYLLAKLVDEGDPAFRGRWSAFCE